MTNEQAKHEAIKKAFGDKWELFTDDYKQHLLERKHWVDMSVKYGTMVVPNYSKSPTPQIMDFNGEIEEKCEFWRPIQLKGIEDNNGWTRIEPDGSNLPPFQLEIFPAFDVLDSKGNVNQYWIVDGMQNYWLNHFTHYKPIQPKLMPVY